MRTLLLFACFITSSYFVRTNPTIEEMVAFCLFGLFSVFYGMKINEN